MIRPADRLPRSIRIGQAVRRYFVTGLAALFPVAITLWVLVTIFKFADGFLGHSLGFQIPGVGILVTVLIILAVGMLSSHFLGRLVLPTVETWFSRLPLVKKIYPAVKQFGQFIFNEENRQTAFRRVVLVQYPRLGAYSLAFVTNEIVTTATGRPQTLLTLLLPNPPSPFTGPIIFVPKEDVVMLTMTVEEAAHFIVSGGVVLTGLAPASLP